MADSGVIAVTGDGRAIVKVLEAKIAKLDLQLGDVLVFFAPEEWTAKALVEFAEFAKPRIEVALEHRNQILFLPHGAELAILRTT
jgi:hypothetical protein